MIYTVKMGCFPCIKNSIMMRKQKNPGKAGTEKTGIVYQYLYLITNS